MKLLQLGSESSGNRLVHRVLQTSSKPLEMVGYSLPHGDEMPDVHGIVQRERPDKILLVWRHSCQQSYRAWKNRHTVTLREAIAERDEAEELLAGVEGDVYVLLYDLLVRNPSAQIANLARWLGVELFMPEPIMDMAA